MRLNDKDIFGEDPEPEDEYEFGRIDGMKEARDFYENQTCETCKHSGKCKIEKIGKLVIKPFGCKKWE